MSLGSWLLVFALSFLLNVSPAFVTTRIMNQNAARKPSCVLLKQSNNDSAAQAQELLRQAAALREQATDLRLSIQREAATRQAREEARIDQWIDDLLVAGSRNGDESKVELLYTVEQVTQRLVDRRVSEEHIMKIFRRLSQQSPQSRSRCSPLVQLLVDAAGRMDSIEREEQPNKRWSGKVERKLRQRLFAMDWNIDMDDLDATSSTGRDDPRLG